MKTLVTVIALTALVASPALAAKRQQTTADTARGAYAQSINGAYLDAPAAVFGPAGKYLGQDPDPSVRQNLHRDGWQH